MAGNHSWTGQEIDELPAEILSFSIKDIPRSTLKEIAMRLNKDSIAGNWEALAEKLGFTQITVLDDLIERARVQSTYPGLLMLQDWACRPGSTAFVLLHALREIQREDVQAMLVQKLFELNSLQLSVSVEGRTGVTQFLRVGTRKSAPLHASLENILQNPLYWYDIVGPRRDVDWNTPSGDLQGVQLTLRLRGEPNQHSLEQIYGTAMPLYQPASQSQPDHQPAMPLPVDGGQGSWNQLKMNIPPTQPAISLTLGGDHLNMRTEGPVVLSGNNLSGNIPLNIPLTTQGNLNMPPPPACGPRSASPRSMPEHAQPELFQAHDMLAGFQHTTQPDDNYPVLPNLSDFNGTFLYMTSENGQCTVSVPPPGAVVGGDSRTFPMELCSQTGPKQPVTFQAGRSPREDDEGRPLQGAARPTNLAAHAALAHLDAAFQGLESPDKDNAAPTCSSLLHQDYVSHNSVIEFCNNPTSPLSCSGGSSPSTPHAMTSGAHSHFLGPQPFRRAGAQQAGTPPGCKNWKHSGYVPHSFIEQMSHNFRRSASAPNLDGDDQMEEEESAADNPQGDEGMDYTEAQSTRPGRPSSDNLSTSMPTEGLRDLSKPAPCGFSSYRPGMGHHYQNLGPAHPLTHSVSMDAGDGGYIDMTGTHSTPSSQQQQDSGHASEDPRLRPSSSFDSYMNDSPSRFGADGAQSLDTGVPRSCDEGLDEMLHPRNRRPFPPSGDNMFQPRNRHPVTHDHDMLLSDESSAEYTYIDPVPLRGESSDCDSRGSSTPRPNRRSSGGSLTGGKHESGHRKKSYRRELSDSELQQVPGWNSTINDKTVEQEMQKYINDDGNFIVWRYTVGGKYVISVSHLRSIRHYAVYETAKEGKVYYYIFPKGCARFTSLGDLVKYCMTQGVSEPTKTFKSPDGKETQRGSGRFSHVRLKTPIPPRRRN